MPDTLEKFFDFNESDLVMNQKGQLSEKQFRIIAQYRQMGKFFNRLAVIAILLSLGKISFFALYNIEIDLKSNPGPVVAYIIFISIGTLLLMVSLLIGKLRSDLKAGKISVVEGCAEKKKKKMPRQLGTAFYIEIDNVRFQLDEQAKYQAIKSDTRYRIYYIRHLPHIILSVMEISV